MEFDDVVSFIKGTKRNLPRKPYSLWKHFPGQDLRPEDSVKAHVQFQEVVQSDLIKISPHSKYALVDFGVEFNPAEYNKETGSYITKKRPIVQIDDWEKIDEYDPQTGELGKQIELVRQLSKQIDSVPTMMTVFLPTMIARKLVHEDKLIDQFNENKELIKDRLQVITKVTTEYAKICIEAGATGLFVATQETDPNEGWSPDIWNQIAYPFDKQVIEKVRSKAEFQVLHLHGEDIFFKEVLRKLSVEAINFHAFPDFPSFFSSSEMTRIYDGTLLGGLEDNLFIDTLDKNSLETRIDDLIQSNKPVSSQMILSPNCVLPQETTTDRLRDIITKIRS